MGKNMTVSTLGFLQDAMRWADPMWWIFSSVLLLLMCTIHVFPLELKEAENHSFSDRILVLSRKIMIVSFLVLVVLMPIMVCCLFGIVVPESKRMAFNLFMNWFKEMARNYWTLPVGCIIAGNMINFCWHRYGEPYLSNLRRKYRVTQAVDEYSDARKENLKYESRRFDPEKYFQEGKYFVGLDLQNKPIYIDAELFENTNTGKFAPTRFGKGVSAGVLLTQSIRRGNSTFMIDPKGDKRLPYILQAEALKAGKPFVYLDLNPEGKGTWEPFKGGPLRHRRARILSAFGLESSGTNADVYKSKERSIVDKIMEMCDGTLRDMKEAVYKIIPEGDLSQLRDGLTEWSQISTFSSNRKKKGHSIETSLLNGAVVYVRSSITDAVVKKATRAYITELMQEAQRLHPQRTTHLTVFADEARFITSQQLVDALATGLEFRTNLILATQAVSDLENLEDKTIDGKALRSSFEINCQIKFIYKAGDVPTAEWGELLSGTKWIRVARNEKTEVNRWGGEKWDRTRAFDQIEVPLIDQNVFLHLPPMVAVLYMPGSVAQVVFSSWMAVDQSNCTWEKRDKDEDANNDPPHDVLENSPAASVVDVSKVDVVPRAKPSDVKPPVPSVKAVQPGNKTSASAAPSKQKAKPTMRPNPAMAVQKQTTLQPAAAIPVSKPQGGGKAPTSGSKVAQPVPTVNAPVIAAVQDVEAMDQPAPSVSVAYAEVQQAHSPAAANTLQDDLRVQSAAFLAVSGAVKSEGAERSAPLLEGLGIEQIGHDVQLDESPQAGRAVRDVHRDASFETRGSAGMVPATRTAAPGTQQPTDAGILLTGELEQSVLNLGYSALPLSVDAAGRVEPTFDTLEGTEVFAELEEDPDAPPPLYLTSIRTV